MEASRLLSWLQASPVRALLANFSTPSSQASMGETGVGDRRDGQQGRYRHGRDGQSRGCNAPGTGDMGLRPRVVSPRPAEHVEAWGEHDASPGQTSSAKQPPGAGPTRNETYPGEHLVLVQLLQLGPLLQPGKYQAIRTLISYSTLSTCREAELYASRPWRVVSEATHDGSNAHSRVETCLILNT